MIKKLLQILVVTIIFVAGCADSNPAKPVSARKAQRIDTPAGMIDYLQKQRLPVLESVQEWDNEYGPGLKLITGHYEIYTTLLEPLMLSQVPGFMESAYRGYNSQLPQSIETKQKFIVYLFAERQQWEDFTRSFAGAQAPLYLKIKAGAYYLNGVCVTYNIGRERTFSVLGHEGWHQFNSRHFKFRLPSWLDEGIAMLFEVSRYDKGIFYFEPGRNLYRLGDLKKSLIEGQIIPLEQLIVTNPGEVLITDQAEAVRSFYCQSYALVRFLREEDYGKRLSNFHQMLLGGLWGSWPLDEESKRVAADRNIPLTVKWNRTVGPKLFRQYISDDFKQIEKEYILFCRKIVYHIHFK